MERYSINIRMRMWKDTKDEVEDGVQLNRGYAKTYNRRKQIREREVGSIG